MKERKAKIKRVTKETKIDISLNLVKSKPVKFSNTIPFMNHMLELLAHHGKLSLSVKAQGDTYVDSHHLVEDLGIVLGQAIKKALGEKKGINRYGNFLLPMDEALSYVAVDLSGRPFLDYSVKFKFQKSGFDFSLLKEFFYAFAINSGITLHISMRKGSNCHHIAESVFKGLGRALGEAIKLNSKQKGVPSTKGKL
ncbi:MAG: imidazoleglycerol-phosphate dehydratase HisB [Elusimicrobia bacterium]|nr:imidazoleglycerol-phosphate dehydratase HisB [Elusimicrobiota bacterium]